MSKEERGDLEGDDQSIYIWCEFGYNIQLFVVKVIYLNLLKSIISYNYLQQKLLQRLSNYIKETFVWLYST